MRRREEKKMNLNGLRANGYNVLFSLISFAFSLSVLFGLHFIMIAVLENVSVNEKRSVTQNEWNKIETNERENVCWKMFAFKNDDL